MLGLLLASSLALAAEANHTSSIDLFEDGQPGAPDWKAARSGMWTRPWIAWTINAMQGDGAVDFGDVRFRDEVVTGRKDVDVVMAIRVGGIDDYMWPYWEEEPGLWLASKPKNPNSISSDPSTRIWADQPGFYLFDHEITDLKVVGLPYSSKTQIEVIWLAVTGSHDSMASHGLTHCVGTDLILDRTPKDTFMCGGTDLNLLAIGYQLIRPFPSAPEVAPTQPREESPLDDLLPLLDNPPGMGLK